MYHVTLINLTPDARHADVNLGMGKSRPFCAEELCLLLETFGAIDPLQNAEADPEIRLSRPGASYVVRAAGGRLLFSDGRDNIQPTLALSAHEILAELDGSGAAARSRPPFPLAAASGTGAAASGAAIVPRKRRARRVTLCAVATLLLGGVVSLFALRDADPEPDFAPLAAAELAAALRQVEGVYVTGGDPGDRGIVVAADGAIRIFELSAGGAPNFVHGTWQAGRIDGALCLRVPQIRTVVTIVDRESVVYCGERYLRAAAL